MFIKTHDDGACDNIRCEKRQKKIFSHHKHDTKNMTSTRSDLNTQNANDVSDTPSHKPHGSLHRIPSLELFEHGCVSERRANMGVSSDIDEVLK